MKKIFIIVLLIFISNTISFAQNDIEGKLKSKYTYVYRSSNGYEVKIGDKVGWCDKDGKEIIAPTKYTYVAQCYVGFHVAIGDKAGWCDKDGKEIIAPTKYTYVSKYDKGFNVEIGDKVGWCDNNGKEIIAPTKYTYVYRSSNGFDVKIGDKVGWCDINGKEIIAPTKYTYVSKYDKGFDVKIDDKEGWCDKDGKEIIAPTKYTYVAQCYKGFLVAIGDKAGWCDINGKEILDAIYEGIFPSEDLFAAKKEGKWGYVSALDGSVVIPFEYDEASKFQDGVARVKKNGKTELISNPLKVVAQNDKPKVKGKAVSTYPAPNSDVDNNIPIGKKADDNTFAFIIANENYPMAKVPYALNDGWIFEQYCKKTLGLKDDNVRIYEDATGGNIHACIEQIKQIATAYDGDANIIFYYAGHAFPDEDKNTAYLLPIDGDSKNINTGYSLEKLYKELNSVKTKSVVCFIDACFSGATREDEMLLAGRGVAIKVKDDVPLGNIVVFTSATGAETAHQYEEKGHGLFTYYLLQKLQETKGNVTLGDLSEHVRKMVRRKSVLINQKMQTPTVIPSQALQDKWQKIKL